MPPGQGRSSMAVDWPLDGSPLKAASVSAGRKLRTFPRTYAR
jgi:hypothetical protein